MQKIPPTPIKATIYWANLKQPNKMSGKYQVDLGNLSSKAVAALEERGVPIRNKNNEAGIMSRLSLIILYVLITLMATRFIVL